MVWTNIWQYLGTLAGQSPNAPKLAAEIEASNGPKRSPSAVVWELFFGLGKIGDADSCA